MADVLQGRTVAILAADGVERVELEEPRRALDGAGACTVLLSLADGEIQARDHDLEDAGTSVAPALTLRGAQQHGHRYVPEILERMERDEVTTEHLATHVMSLDDGPTGYRMFKDKEDGCVRAVFRPGG
ncbi:hypothetical protein [Cellulomonas hominis]|uniref:hypothetical protein n=1 Tax=Cellulomonas hominis TaxID=156981 RepID=UPI001B92BA4A|nr:hypothetical protein [Cellulomonas hominis]VTR78803.1 hypothetical protein CHMI_03589 [Cellulomonas hominis]